MQSGVIADLAIYLTESNEPAKGYLAWATSCQLNFDNNRPIAGQLNFNLDLLSTNSWDFKNQMDTFLHEVRKYFPF